MTRRKNAKRLARERAARTRESYITALRIVRAHAQETAVTTPRPRQPQPPESISGYLVSAGLLSQEDLDSVLEEHQRTNKSLGAILLDRKLVAKADLLAAMAARMGIDSVDLDTYPVDSRAATLIPYNLVRQYISLPIGWDEDGLIVATGDPGNLVALDAIRKISGSEVKTVLAWPAAICAASMREANRIPWP